MCPSSAKEMKPFVPDAVSLKILCCCLDFQLFSCVFSVEGMYTWRLQPKIVEDARSPMPDRGVVVMYSIAL